MDTYRQPRIYRALLRSCTFAAIIAAMSWPATNQAAETQSRARSGKEVVDTVCAACHGTGAQGAPKIGDRQAWQMRASQGLSSLTQHAIDGIRKMPAHGGSSQLTDLEMARAVTHMVNQSGGHWVEPVDKAAQTVERSGRQIVEERCAKCHQAGVGGAPRIGDRSAWIPRLRNGLDATVRSAIRGYGGMEPRGGAADLTDSEVRGAILYMINKDAGPKK